ncbi:MAG: helix-turn-helix domain-containing protein [Candidatus Nitrosopolaris sp.]
MSILSNTQKPTAIDISFRATKQCRLPLGSGIETDSQRNQLDSGSLGFSSKTLAIRLKELQKVGILERQAFNEIPPKVEYRLTNKGQELVESVIGLLQWMRKWSNQKY